jgi:hypothetical protein
MDPISSLLKLLEYQRQQSSGQVNKDTARGNANTVAAGSHLTGRTAATLEEVKLSVKEQLKKMDKKDPDFSGKAFRIFVHNILAWKLGSEILNDTTFNEIAYDVERLMLQDANLKRQFEIMLNELV